MTSRKPTRKPARRPARKRESIDKQLLKRLSMIGLTIPEIARALDVSESTLRLAMTNDSEVRDAIKDGALHADARVVNALYRRAVGYRHRATKIMQHNGVPVIVPYTEIYPPDTVACIFWLRNRHPDLWKNDPEKKGKGGTPVNVNITLSAPEPPTAKMIGGRKVLLTAPAQK